MTALLAALFIAFVFLGGGLVDASPITGLGLTALGAIGLGTMFAAVKSAALSTEAFDTREGLSVGELMTFLAANSPTVKLDTKIYVGDSGLNIAGAVFSCILDGRRTVVIERMVEETVEDLWGV